MHCQLFRFRMISLFGVVKRQTRVTSSQCNSSHLDHKKRNTGAVVDVLWSSPRSFEALNHVMAVQPDNLSRLSGAKYISIKKTDTVKLKPDKKYSCPRLSPVTRNLKTTIATIPPIVCLYFFVLMVKADGGAETQTRSLSRKVQARDELHKVATEHIWASKVSHYL